jgi:hypothetical protein
MTSGQPVQAFSAGSSDATNKQEAHSFRLIHELDASVPDSGDVVPVPLRGFRCRHVCLIRLVGPGRRRDRMGVGTPIENPDAEVRRSVR